MITGPISEQQLQPLPLPKSESITTKKVMNYAGFIFTMGLVCSYVGASFAIVYEVAIWQGVILGALIGAVIGIALSRFSPILPIKEAYACKVFKVIAPHTEEKQALADVQKIFNKALSFSQTYENHQLHDAITSITKSLKYLDHKQVWDTFLEYMDQTQVQNADGEMITLDFAAERDLLREKEIFPSDPKELDPSDEYILEDLAQLEAIQKVNLGKEYTFSQEEMLNKLQEDPEKNRCVVIRRQVEEGSEEDRGEILGFIWVTLRDEEYFLEKIAHKSNAIARKRDALNLGIKELLLIKLIDTQPHDKKLSLYMRISDPAIPLYKKWAFKLVKDEQRDLYELPDYYPSSPKENAYKMMLDWGEIERRIQAAQEAQAAQRTQQTA